MNARHRAAWLVDQLERGPGAPPPGLAEPDREALAREAAACHVLWLGLAEADAPIAAEAPPAWMVGEYNRRLAALGNGTAARSWPRRKALAWIAASAAIAVVVLALLHTPRSPVPGERGPSEAPTLNRLEAVLAHPRPGTSRMTDIETLTQALYREPSPNVRLAALEALTERYGRAGLEGRLGPALAGEADPIVLVTMIRSIGRLGLAADAGALRVLVNRKDLDPIARRAAEQALAEMS